MAGMGGDRFIVMLGTDYSAPGGITAVLRSYLDGGLFERWPVRFLPTYRRDSPVDKALTAVLALARFSGWLAQGRVCLIHAHSASRGSFWRKSVFLLLGKLAGSPVVLHIHSGEFPIFYWNECGRLAKWGVRHVLARMDRVVVLTPAWVGEIRKIQPSARFAVIANPVSPLPIPRQPQEQEVLFLGRLRREKGIYDLIEATAKLAVEFPGIKIVCAGDGDIAALRTHAGRLGVGRNMEFPGWVDGTMKDALLARATAFVLPSYFEGLPMGVLEAMANGIPVVATRIGGIPDAVGNDAAILVEPGDVESLAAALAALLADPDLRLKMGQAGKLRVSKYFDREKVLAQIGELYRHFGIPVVAGATGGI